MRTVYINLSAYLHTLCMCVPWDSRTSLFFTLLFVPFFPLDLSLKLHSSSCCYRPSNQLPQFVFVHQPRNFLVGSLPFWPSRPWTPETQIVQLFAALVPNPSQAAFYLHNADNKISPIFAGCRCWFLSASSSSGSSCSSRYSLPDLLPTCLHTYTPTYVTQREGCSSKIALTSSVLAVSKVKPANILLLIQCASRVTNEQQGSLEHPGRLPVQVEFEY